MQLHLRRFDITSITDDSVIVFIGKRRTGKSFLVKDLLYYNRGLPIGTVISGTESANRFYGNIIPDLFIHDEYTPEIISNVLNRQKLIVKKVNSDVEKKGKTLIDPRAFLILDDCLYDNSWIKDKNIRSLFMNGRHFKTMFMITMQYPLGIPPNLRTNIDYVFIFRENNIANRRRIYENYAGMFPTFENFCVVLDQCTENHECMVVQINVESNSLTDQVFWYKADAHGDFKIGAREFWQLHKENYNDKHNDEDGEELFDATAAKRKKGSMIHVKKGGY